MKISGTIILGIAVLVFCVEAGAEVQHGGVALEEAAPYDTALLLARRLFYNPDRTDRDLAEARGHFRHARKSLAPSKLGDCEFWLTHPTQNLKRAEQSCLRALGEDEYYALMALAHIYELGPEKLRSPANAYKCYLLVAQVKTGDLYEPAKAGRERVGRELPRAERREIEKQAGIGWSLF